MLEEEYNSFYDDWRNSLYETNYGYGMRVGKCESDLTLFRNKSEWLSEDKKKKYLSPDVYLELQRFHEKYGNLPLKTMTTRLLKESEFLIGIFK